MELNVSNINRDNINNDKLTPLVDSFKSKGLPESFQTEIEGNITDLNCIKGKVVISLNQYNNNSLVRRVDFLNKRIDTILNLNFDV